MAMKKAHVWIMESKDVGEQDWTPNAATAQELKSDAKTEERLHRQHFGKHGEKFRIRKYVREEPNP